MTKDEKNRLQAEANNDLEATKEHLDGVFKGLRNLKKANENDIIPTQDPAEYRRQMIDIRKGAQAIDKKLDDIIKKTDEKYPQKK